MTSPSGRSLNQSFAPRPTLTRSDRGRTRLVLVNVYRGLRPKSDVRLKYKTSKSDKDWQKVKTSPTLLIVDFEQNIR